MVRRPTHPRPLQPRLAPTTLTPKPPSKASPDTTRPLQTWTGDADFEMEKALQVRSFIQESRQLLATAKG
jgi:hypothetical protein